MEQDNNQDYLSMSDTVSTETQTTLSDWEVGTEAVSVEEIDAALAAWREAKDDYDRKKKISNEADKVAKEKMRQLEQIMERAGKTSWENEDGKAIVAHRMQVTTPKTPEEKKKLFQHFKEQGEEVFWSYVSVNSQTLNAYYNQAVANDPQFELPGVEAPTANSYIQFRRSRK